MKICKECGRLVNEPEFSVLVKIEQSNRNMSQSFSRFDSLEEITAQSVAALLELAKKEFAKIPK